MFASMEEDAKIKLIDDNFSFNESLSDQSEETTATATSYASSDSRRSAFRCYSPSNDFYPSHIKP